MSSSVFQGSNGYNGESIDITCVNPYKFVTDAYNGSGGFKSGQYLAKFAREYDFNKRKSICFYENFTKGAADSLYVPVFSNEAVRVTDSDLFKAFIDNADNNGNHLQEVMKTAAKYATLHGISFIVMDNFENTPESLQATIDGRLFPYIYIKTADTVKDYEIDSFGHLIEIIFYDGEYEYLDKDNNECETDAYRFWDITETYRFYRDKEGNKIIIGEAKPITIGALPVIAIQKDIDYEEFLPNPPFYDIARMNCAIFNGSSELNNIQRQQAFCLLVLPTNDQNPNLEIGANSVLCVDPQSSIMPDFISPDAAIMTVVQGNIESIVKSLLDSANVLGASSVSTSGSTSSGVALSYEFLGQHYILNTIANLMVKSEKLVASLFKLYTNTEFEYAVKYDTNFKPNIMDIKLKYEILEKIYNLSDDSTKVVLKKSMIGLLMQILGESDDFNSLIA